MPVVIHVVWQFDGQSYPHPSGFARGSEMNKNCAVSAVSAAHIMLSKLQQPQTTQQKTIQGHLKQDLPSYAII